jgi:hypothetical protein
MRWPIKLGVAYNQRGQDKSILLLGIVAGYIVVVYVMLRCGIYWR